DVVRSSRADLAGPGERTATERPVDQPAAAHAQLVRPGLGQRERDLPAQISSLAAAYAAKSPCQSRWSGARLRIAAATGRTDGAECSWKLDSSTASTSYGGSAVTASTTGRPTLPVATARSPAARSIDSSIRTVVVLPLVPVSASQGGGFGPRSRQASSTSPITSTPAAAAAVSSGASGRQPGETTSRSVPAGGACAPSAIATPSAASASVRADAAPDAPAPATTTRRPAQPVTVAPLRLAAPTPCSGPERHRLAGRRPRAG